MKKLFLTMCVALFTLGASAQTDQGDKVLGAHAEYATDHGTVGLGLKGRYNFLDNVRGEVDFDYFIKKDHVSMWDVNAFAHYLLPLGDTFTLYPLAGVGLTNWKSHDLTDGNGSGTTKTETKLAIYLGAGFDYYFMDNLGFNIEGKYQIVEHYSQLIISAGIIYKF